MTFKAFCFDSLKLAHLNNSHFNLLFRCKHSSASKNPYEVLGVKSDCSTKEVKQAYIELCKKLHPDMSPGDATQHRKFVELNKAYTTLSNADTRKQYDRGDFSSESGSNVGSSASGPYYRRDDPDWHEKAEYWQFQQQATSQQTSHRFNQSLTLFGCFVLVVIGSILNYSAYSSFATRYTRVRVDEKSKKISKTYKIVRDKAMTGTNAEKIEELEKRFKKF